MVTEALVLSAILFVIGTFGVLLVVAIVGAVVLARRHAP